MFWLVFRVYDNAQANAVMQKALMTLSIWESMTNSRRNAFYSYMETSCNPFKEYYDDDMTEEGEEDMKKVTIQIKVREPLWGVFNKASARDNFYSLWVIEITNEYPLCWTGLRKSALFIFIIWSFIFHCLQIGK